MDKPEIKLDDKIFADERELEFTIIKPGEVAGYYEVNHFRIQMSTKPRWFHRKMMHLCLGWKWVDSCA